MNAVDGKTVAKGQKQSDGYEFIHSFSVLFFTCTERWVLLFRVMLFCFCFRFLCVLEQFGGIEVTGDI